MIASFPILISGPKVDALVGGFRDWWDIARKKFVRALTLYIPFGCPDWGESDGDRNILCTFCALPNAVQAYRDEFNQSQPIILKEHAVLFKSALQQGISDETPDTVCVFNGGSFLAMPFELQMIIAEEIAGQGFVRRLVVESRAQLILDGGSALGMLAKVLRRNRIDLTIRVGVETQDDDLRNKKLKKGHGRKQLLVAAQVMRDNGITSGGYVLLNPAPGLDPRWAMEEAGRTLDFVLGDGNDQLRMDEAYFCSANVAPETPLETAWKTGRFIPASLWMVYAVLKEGIARYGSRVHLLPFKDEPAFEAVPSNHALRGIRQDLSDAQGCDRAFHHMLESYRNSMNPKVLVPPICDCRPHWA